MSDVNLPFMVVRKFLSADATRPANTRYNPDCECVQTSPDNGVTWVDNPAADPRQNDAFRLPARGGDDPRCDAAEAMMQHFKAQVDAFLASASILAFVNSALAITSLFFPEIALFTVPLFVIGESLLAIGSITIAAAMTEEVYDQIKCILYCHLDAIGQMSVDQLAAVQSDVDTQIGGTPNLVFDLFAGLWGAVEWSNAGAVGEYTGDCSDCECAWCAEFDFTVDGGTAWTFSITTDYGSVTSGGIISGYFPPPSFAGTQALQVGWNIPDSGFNINRVEMDVNFPSSLNNYANFTYNGGTPAETIPPPGDSMIVFDDGLAHTVQSTGIYMQAYPLLESDIITLKKMRWFGIGTRPVQLEEIPECP